MSKEKPLKQFVDKLLRAYGYQDQLDEIDLINNYEELVGKMIANHTKEVFLKNKVFYVKLDSAALKQELSYAKEDLVQKLNKSIGRRVIEKMVIT